MVRSYRPTMWVSDNHNHNHDNKFNNRQDHVWSFILMMFGLFRKLFHCIFCLHISFSLFSPILQCSMLNWVFLCAHNQAIALEPNVFARFVASFSQNFDFPFFMFVCYYEKVCLFILFSCFLAYDLQNLTNWILNCKICFSLCLLNFRPLFLLARPCPIYASFVCHHLCLLSEHYHYILMLPLHYVQI